MARFAKRTMNGKQSYDDQDRTHRLAPKDDISRQARSRILVATAP